MIGFDLAYDDDRHVTLCNGRDVPHVTTVLSKVGVSTDFDVLAAVAHVDVELARHRGRAVHADCHALDDGEIKITDCDPRVRPYVKAWEHCCAEKGLEPIAHQRERQIFHPQFWYTGILDGVFACNGKRILGDLKTGDPEDAAAHLQTAAYEEAWNFEHPDEPIDERWAIWLVPERVIPYRIINYTKRADAVLDFGKFAACLTVYNEQPQRRKRVA